MCLQFFSLTIGTSKGTFNINIQPLEQKKIKQVLGTLKKSGLFSVLFVL